MKDVADYLNRVKALIILTPQIIHWEIVREEAQGDVGLFRYRLTLCDDSLLEMFELFAVVDEVVRVQKYSFHWQTREGGLIKRWDNAAHHPEVTTYPHHVHDGAELSVAPHQFVDADAIFALIVEELGAA